MEESKEVYRKSTKIEQSLGVKKSIRIVDVSCFETVTVCEADPLLRGPPSNL